METTPFVIEISQQSLTLDPSGAIYWQQPQILIVADLHLGRETVLQRSSLPMPTGATSRTLEKLNNCIDRYRPNKLLVLGDLIHARSAMTAELYKQLHDCLSHTHSGLETWLIEGNHDRGSRQILASLPLMIFPPPIYVAPFWLMHDEQSEATEIEGPEGFYLSGHLHPGVKLGPGSDTLKSFYQRSRGLILPSFGEITGLAKVKPQSGEICFVTTGQQVLRYTGRTRQQDSLA